MSDGSGWQTLDKKEESDTQKLLTTTPYRGVAFNNRVFCTGGGYADVFDLCDFPMRS